MLQKLRNRMTYANVMSSIAVFMAMSGVAWAATLPKNSVGSTQIKSNAVTSKKIKTGQVAGSDVKDSGLTGTDVKDGGLAGADIADGGLNGADIANGGIAAADLAPGTIPPSTSVTYRTFLANAAGNNTIGEAGATCNTGEKLIGGGGGWVPDVNVDPPTAYLAGGTISVNAPATAGDKPIQAGSTPAEWFVTGKNTTGGSARMYAYAACATP
jgi:hypothetical protein